MGRSVQGAGKGELGADLVSLAFLSLPFHLYTSFRSKKPIAPHLPIPISTYLSYPPSPPSAFPSPSHVLSLVPLALSFPPLSPFLAALSSPSPSPPTPSQVYKFDEDTAERVTAYASFGGLLMALSGSYRHVDGVTVGEYVYLLIRR